MALPASASARLSTPFVLGAAADALLPLMGRVELEALQTLGGSHRSLVIRAAVHPTGGDGAGRPGMPATVVVKAYDTETSGNAVVREPAALGMLRSLPPGFGPDLIATAGEPPLVVLADAGAHPSLSDLIRGHDAAAARSGVIAWAERLGSLHAATHGRASDFGGRLRSEASRLGVETPSLDDMDESLSWVAETLPKVAATLGVDVEETALAEVRSLDAHLGGGDGARAFTPADACPDNNLLAPNGLMLVDYENAEYRHVAWDAAYLTVPWPSCWCSFLMPEDVVSDALATWRRVAGAAMPYVLTPEFERDLELTTAAWAIISSAWFLDQAVNGTASFFHEQTDVAPPAPALLQHRLSLAASTACAELAAVRLLAASLLPAAVAAWGDKEVGLGAAFL